jgi:peptide-methionine (R)-S-oxide reductase
MQKITKTDAEWRAQLTDEEYRITRKHGTERPFTGPYCNSKEEGVFSCKCCGLPLFEAATKYDSGTGWPSFYASISKENVAEKADNTFFMRRTEVLCARCDAHLGHVFPDGPKPTGLRYCMNGHALTLEKKKG